MEIKIFFSFGSKLISSTVQASAIDLKVNENRAIDSSKLITGLYDGIDFPIVFKQEHGKNFTDILDTGWHRLYLISDRMKSILKDNHLTGWQTFPIKLYDKHGNEIPAYNGFSIIGRSGPTNYDKSEIIEKREVPTGPLCEYYKGVFFDNWDGSDFFIPDNTHHIFITKKAACILKNNKITNMKLKNLSEQEMPVYFIKRK